jgi:sulfite reductase (NADPH) hemoprotein beta-component
VPGYAAVTLSLKKQRAPGDITSEQMLAVADRPTSTASANCASATSRTSSWPTSSIRSARCGEGQDRRPGHPNIGLLTGIICCPAATSATGQRQVHPHRHAIPAAFDDLDYLFDIGEIDLNISGCMNACGHHHVGHIGVLGGQERFRVLPGHAGRPPGQRCQARQGDRPVRRRGMPDVVDKIIVLR